MYLVIFKNVNNKLIIKENYVNNLSLALKAYIMCLRRIDKKELLIN